MESQTAITSNVTSSSLGPLFVGYVFGLILLGYADAYVFYSTPEHIANLNGPIMPRDKSWMKVFVATLFVLNLLNTTFNFTIFCTIFLSTNRSSVLVLDAEPILTVRMVLPFNKAWKNWYQASVSIFSHLRAPLLKWGINPKVGGILNSVNITNVTNMSDFEDGKDPLFEQVFRVSVQTGSSILIGAFIDAVVYLSSVASDIQHSAVQGVFCDFHFYAEFSQWMELQGPVNR
ncbi:hypothetical protein CPB84DRAFT_1746330 [Gymnopilus junonius]|uniref:Uncharacterized protein n=1 Tax=Gymnopilus junonius TaxID=109634 RepID=A0A9P5NRQ6_GYMJU|nr:hypothetical protein CPB84DRAFT_1746330 [Gymnopilus junonius]